ncbi:UNVERIFIED_CONTAM: hypothetical protein FKN15_005716 [Acipenser sinensis]
MDYAALSVLLEQLDSRHEAEERRREESDAVENILGSLLIAGCYCETPALQLVSVLFDNMVFQGNRVTKVDCSAFHAFSSPNSLPLVELGVTIKGVCRVLWQVRSVLSGAGGVILETYGSGNAPDDKWFLDTLKQANRHGVFLLNVTQVLQGSVMPIYQTSKGLREAGVLSGYDITSEAALTKMIWTLKKYTTQDQRKKVCLQLILYLLLLMLFYVTQEPTHYSSSNTFI